MINPLAYAILAAGLLLAGWTGLTIRRDRPTTEAQMIGTIVFEVALAVQSVIALVRLAQGVHLIEPATFVAYAVGILLPLPLGFQLARIERTKWGSGILCFTSVVAALMTLRLLQLWRASS